MMSNKRTSLTVPQHSHSHQSHAPSLEKKTKGGRSTTLSHLFHGTKKWGSFSKSTINKKKDADDLHHSTDIDDYHAVRSICNFFNFLPIFHPIGPLKCCWDGIVMVMLIYTSVEIPYTLSFQIDLTLSSPFGIIAFCIDICLCIDIILNFRTAYFDKFDHLKLIINPTVIAKKYLCGWFVIDLITSLPMEFMIPNTNESANNVATYIKMFRFFRLIRVIKILRLLKMVKLFDGVMKRLVVRELLVAFRLLKIISFMLLYAHFSACLWYYIGCKSNARYGVSWISENTDLVTPECSASNDENAAISSTFTRYSFAWYWSVVTLFTTGYGDITAQNIEEQWVASVSILIGTCFFAYFVGTLTTLISEGDRISSEILSKMEEAQHFCDKKKLPREMARAVLTHTRYHCNYNCIWDESSILSHLPPYLQSDISLYVAKKLMLSNIDFFQEILDPEVRGSIALKMRSISCNNGYQLYKKGDLAKDIYIQRTGKSVHLIDTKMGKKKRLQLHRGDVCGEYSLILKKRASTVLCATWCEFYVIDINDIIEALQQHYGNRWEKKWARMKKFVKKEYVQPFSWKKKRHLKLQRNPTPSVYSNNNDIGYDDVATNSNNIVMHGVWNPTQLPSIRSTIRSEEIGTNLMFQHVLHDSGQYSQEIEGIKHDVGISISIDEIAQSNNVNLSHIQQHVAETELIKLQPLNVSLKDRTSSSVDRKPFPTAATINEFDLQQNKRKPNERKHKVVKAKSFDADLIKKEKDVNKSGKSPLRWLDSIRGDPNEANMGKKRESKKKKKTVWFGLTRQNSELRDKAVVEQDPVNIATLRKMFSDYQSDSDQNDECIPAISRAKSERQRVYHGYGNNLSPSNTSDDFPSSEAFSEPNLYLQRSRSLNNLARKKHFGHRHHKKVHKMRNKEGNDIDEEHKETRDEISKTYEEDSNNTDSISVNNDGDISGSESSNTMNSQPVPTMTNTVKSNQNMRGTSGGSKGGKFQMKKRAKKGRNKKMGNKMAKHMENDDDENHAYDLPTTWISDGAITMSEIEENNLLNKSLHKKQNDEQINDECANVFD